MGFNVKTDHTSKLPDECLAYIFQSLSTVERNNCSIMCRRWCKVDGRNRHRLSLNAQSDLRLVIPSIFSRFDSVTALTLKCHTGSVSIGDEELTLISQQCPKLTCLKLRSCRQLTDAGLEAFVKNCKGLKKLSCGSCTFGARGMNAVLGHCASLEKLSLKNVYKITDLASVESIGPGVAASSLKTICLKQVYDVRLFRSLILGSENLRTLKLLWCPGDWDELLQLLAERGRNIEVHHKRMSIAAEGL